ncbi:hypothetical protein HOLleu_30522 [Holothuria leucospilota]|uniref:Uncharacterized protein n=1 Tax=Holothuria leucospilota TaxID=206669 RepID=A0A9Q1GYY9_HOLLE|nr:hypothetical protein HOLleu_30522 [Holothuria leucospilota]
MYFQCTDAASKAKRKKGTGVGRSHLSILHTLVAGDHVFCSIDETLLKATVKVIDRFLREITVRIEGESEDRILNVKRIVLEEREDQRCERKRRKVKQKTCAEKTLRPEQSAENDDTGIEDGTSFFSTTGGDGSVICCGEVVRIMATTLEMLVSSIRKKGTGFEVHGCLFSCGLSEDIKIAVPAEKIAKIYSSNDGKQDPFMVLLNETCKKRKFVHGAVDCSIREPVWNWLVEELKGAYSPKGTHEAEIIQGVRALISHCMDLFEANFNCACYCNVCKGTYKVFESAGLFICSMMNLQRSSGSLEKALEFEILSQLSTKLKQHRSCKGELQLGDANISLPRFLVVELGLIEGRNYQVPPVQVKEDITVGGISYTLTAAVVMRKGHFLNVVKHDECFIRIDGKPLSGGHTFCANTFAGALKGNETISEHVYRTSPNNLGVHVLLYKRTGSTGQGVISCGQFQTIMLSKTTSSADKPETIDCFSSDEDDKFSVNVQNCNEPLAETRNCSSGWEWESHAPLKTSTPKKKVSNCSSAKQSKKSTQFPCEKGSPVSVQKKQPGYLGTELSDHKRLPHSASKNSSIEKIESTSGDGFRSKNVFECLEDEVNNGYTSIAKGVETVIGVSLSSNTQNSKVDKRKNNSGSFKANQKVQGTHKVKRPFKEIHENTLPSFQSPSQSRNNASKEGSSKFQDIVVNWDDNTLVLDSEKVHFQIHSNNLFLKCTDIFRVLDMSSHIHNKGYTQIEKRLSEHEKENCFLYENKRRKFINLNAVLTLLDAKKGWWKGKHSSVKELLMNLRDKLKLRSNSCEETNSCSSELEEQTSSSTGDVSHNTDCTNDSSSAFVEAEQADYYKRKLKFLKTKQYVSRRRRHDFLKGSVSNIISSVWKGSKQMFLDDIGCLIKPAVRHDSSSSFDKNDIVNVLRQAPPTKKAMKKYDNLLQEISAENYKTPVTVEDVVNLEENFSGTRLFEEMRKRLPNVFPSKREEYKVKKQYIKEFRAVLLPRRTATGWAVDPERLLEVLHFKYYWLEQKKFWRIYGDGREVGVPLENYVFCLLHGLARSVEKLLNLVVADVLSEANIAQQRGEDRTNYIDERLTALENNINKRGVRQGNFRIHFDKHGKPEPIKLNKDCALTIIAPTPQDKEKDFPHVLTNVSTNRPLGRQLLEAVQRKLSLRGMYTEAVVEKDIWFHFYKMFTILKNDPAPILVEGKQEGSLNPEDYIWGYTEQQKESYVHHAECFYQLFVLRYTSKNLTPYMVKFIDYGPIFMEQLPFSMGRYQSEAGEHANYLHNCFYYQHTTRHGGSQKSDPVLAIFSNMWKNLAYSICSGDGTVSGRKVGIDFQESLGNSTDPNKARTHANIR